MHILVIDDNRYVRQATAQVLAKDGHTTHTLCNGREALSYCRSTRVDVVVTDMVMPQCDGAEVILTLREAQCQVAIVAMSGAGCDGGLLYLHGARTLGADVAVTKPVRVGDLRDAVYDAHRRVHAASNAHGARNG